MEILKRKGRALFGDASYDGTVDVSAAYHHMHMRQDAISYLCFEWQGQFLFFVLPLGLAPDQDLESGKGSHHPLSAFYYGSVGSDHGSDAASAPHPPTVRLAHPPDQVRRVRRAYCPIRGRALDTLVEPAAQKFFVPTDKLEYLLSFARDVAEGTDQFPAHALRA